MGRTEDGAVWLQEKVTRRGARVKGRGAKGSGSERMRGGGAGAGFVGSRQGKS